MADLSFFGGVEFGDRKIETRFLKIEDLKPPKLLYVPLRQSVGAENIPIVKVSDKVLMGQKIAESEEYISAPIHSPVSGFVTAIEDVPSAYGEPCKAIVIENDNLYRSVDFEEVENIDELSYNDIMTRIHEGGVCGLSGTVFPSRAKIESAKDRITKCIIINGCESEPYITSDYRIMLEQPQKITETCKILMKVTGAPFCIIAVENMNMDAIGTLRAYSEAEPFISVAVMKAKYPQGSEKQLIKAVTKSELPEGSLPVDCGVLVHNVSTCAAIYDAVILGRPLISRVVTVSGGAVYSKKNYRVSIGTPVSYVFSAAGGFCAVPDAVTAGGAMNGSPNVNFDAPVVKATNALLALTEDETFSEGGSACIRCGKCTASCPSGLQPQLLSLHAKRADVEKCAELNISACIECGCCSYICPAKIHLLDDIKSGKRLAEERSLMEIKAKARAAELLSSMKNKTVSAPYSVGVSSVTTASVPDVTSHGAAAVPGGVKAQSTSKPSANKSKKKKKKKSRR